MTSIDEIGGIAARRINIAFLAGRSGSIFYEDQKSQMLAASRVLGRQVVVAATATARWPSGRLCSARPGRSSSVRLRFANTNEIFALAERYKIPTTYPRRDFVNEKARAA